MYEYHNSPLQIYDKIYTMFGENPTITYRLPGNGRGLGIKTEQRKPRISNW